MPPLPLLLQVLQLLPLLLSPSTFTRPCSCSPLPPTFVCTHPPSFVFTAVAAMVLFFTCLCLHSPTLLLLLLLLPISPQCCFQSHSGLVMVPPLPFMSLVSPTCHLLFVAVHCSCQPASSWAWALPPQPCLCLYQIHCQYTYDNNFTYP